MRDKRFKPGESARIRQSIRCPYSGRVGTVIHYDRSDTKGPYLVTFSDGLQFRYMEHEIEAVNAAGNHRMLDEVYRVLSEAGNGLLRSTILR